MPVGEGGRKHHWPKRKAVLGRAQGKNIAKMTALSLPGEQRVSLRHGGLELPEGFHSKAASTASSEAAATGASDGEERQLLACSWLKTVLLFLPGRKHAALGCLLVSHLAGVLPHHQEPGAQGRLCQDTPPETAGARTRTLSFRSRHPHGRRWGTGLLPSPFS